MFIIHEGRQNRHANASKVPKYSPLPIIRAEKGKKKMEVEVKYVQDVFAVYCSLACVP